MGECPVLFVENVQCLFRDLGNVGVGHVLAACVGARSGKVTEQYQTRGRPWARIQLDRKRTGTVPVPERA